jgi:hypothetical protein
MSESSNPILPRVGCCFGCREESLLTSEHIIPQAIGGRLKATLLCERCNSTTGRQIDAALADQLRPFATILNVRRERGENQPVRVTQVETGKEFDFGPQDDVRRVRPEVRKEFDHNGRITLVDVTASSEKELKKILRGFKQKYGDLEFETSVNQTLLGFAERIDTVGGCLSMRSVAKCAYLLLALRAPAKKVLSEAFDPIRGYIFEDSSERMVSLNYVHTEFMIDRRRFLHGIAIHFDSKKRNVVAYVQLFGTFRFSVLLAKTCPWEIAISDLTYCIDPVTGQEVPLAPGFLAPDITIEQALSPTQPQKLVYTEVAKGLQALGNYSDAISQTTVEFLPPET